ncbi:putative Potassium channel AKT1 [Glarea lozoyensis 74030]|uniref:Putative Potassium channel AKT1 n=1 Tax=Glarea lozoyensis (strain ATCC 74030 / MF5533) TaxID=1104152 RepID=H0EMQ7_GLAL7|nr:putative Potassium channel AKT1 [Glarea lozoyensis 74030]
MAQPIDEFVQAKVEWWNHSFMYQRVAHCGSSCDYSIHFPIGEDDIGYEIDKERALFVAGGADPTEYFQVDRSKMLAAFANSLRSRRKWTEATETIFEDEEELGVTGGYSIKAIRMVASDMVTGNIENVRRYLDVSADSEIFLHGVDAWITKVDSDDEHDSSLTSKEQNDLIQTSGETALHYAACEMYPQMLELLLQKKADPNSADASGRVPLTEAALWGRKENVQMLLNYGADKELGCVRNGKLLRAIDFAKPLRENAEERYFRAGGEYQIYKENTYERDLDRKAIVSMLEDIAGEQSQDRQLQCFAFTKSPEVDTALTLITHFDIPNKWKTIGVLYRGEKFHSVAAMSGWKHSKDSDANLQIAGKSWTRE